MASTTFDTLTTARMLKAAGFESDKAEAIADAMRQAVTEGVAGKADIADVKADIADVKSALVAGQAKLAALQWIVGIQFALVLAIAAKLFGFFGAGQ